MVFGLDGSSFETSKSLSIALMYTKMSAQADDTLR